LESIITTDSFTNDFEVEGGAARYRLKFALCDAEYSRTHLGINPQFCGSKKEVEVNYIPYCSVMIEACGEGQEIKYFDTIQEGVECKMSQCVNIGSNNPNVIPIPLAGFEDEVITVFSQYENPFPDTDLDSLEGKAAAELYRRGIIGGYLDGEFKGYRYVNRAEAAKFLLLARYGFVDELQNNGWFGDVLEGEWYVKFVMRAAALGIIQGYADGFFRPEQTVNTVEFLKMLTLTFGLEENVPYAFTDQRNYKGQWYEKYVGIAQKYNLFPGRNGYFYPEKELTRSEIAGVIYQFLKNR
jgi:hypothetical protein